MTRPLVRKDIHAIAAKLLEQAGVEDPPVRTDVLLARAGLREEAFNPEAFDQASPGAGRVLGLLDLPRGVVYLNGRLRGGRKIFVALHELAHWALPWHRELFFSCNECDLAPGVRRDLEEDANRFAAYCLFLGDRFVEDARSMPFSFRSFAVLKNAYASSFHATLIEYLKAFAGQAALLLLQDGGLPGSVVIKRFYTRGGAPFWIPQGVKLPGEHPLAALFHKTSPGAPGRWHGRWPEDGPRPIVHAFAVDNGFASFAFVREAV